MKTTKRRHCSTVLTAFDLKPTRFTMLLMERIEERYRLRKGDRLNSKRAIDALFLDGRSGFVFPFKYLFTMVSSQLRESEQGEGVVQMMVSVPKRLHKRANRRNLIKRRTKEAYRLDCGELRSRVLSDGVEIRIVLIYVSKGEESYKIIENAVGKIIKEISESV